MTAVRFSEYGRSMVEGEVRDIRLNADDLGRLLAYSDVDADRAIRLLADIVRQAKRVDRKIKAKRRLAAKAATTVGQTRV